MRIEFEIKQNGLVFKDAIELDDSHTLSESEIDKIKNQRFQNWLASTTPENAEE